MKYFKKVIGERIYLSPMNVEDAEKYMTWMCDRSVSDNLGNTRMFNTIEGEKDWILNAGKNGDVNFAIVKNDDTLLGNISLMKINRADRTCTLGIFIGDEENRNKGYGAEAIKLILDFAFNFQNMHNVDLEVFSYNKRAIKCYEKVGFKICGTRHEASYMDGKYHDIIQMEILDRDFNK